MILRESMNLLLAAAYVTRLTWVAVLIDLHVLCLLLDVTWKLLVLIRQYVIQVKLVLYCILSKIGISAFFIPSKP